VFHMREKESSQSNNINGTWRSPRANFNGNISFGEEFLQPGITPHPGEFISVPKYTIPQIAFARQPQQSRKEEENNLLPISLAERVERINHLENHEVPITLNYALGFLEQSLTTEIHAQYTKNANGEIVGIHQTHIRLLAMSEKQERIAFIEQLFPDSKSPYIRPLSPDQTHKRPLSIWQVTRKKVVQNILETFLPPGDLPVAILNRNLFVMTLDLLDRISVSAYGEQPTLEEYKQMHDELMKVKKTINVEPFLPSPEYIAGMIDAGAGAIDLSRRSSKNKEETNEEETENNMQLRLRMIMQGQYLGMYESLKNEYGGSVTPVAQKWELFEGRTFFEAVQPYIRLQIKLIEKGLQYLDERELLDYRKKENRGALLALYEKYDREFRELKQQIKTSK